MTYPSGPWVPEPEAIPAELRAVPRWVRWKLAPEAGNKKPRKVPLTVSAISHASSTDPATWGQFAEAHANATSPPSVGVGFVLGRNGTRVYVGVDLDHVRDVETGDLAAEATEIVGRCGTYTEISPSGRGVKLFGYVPADSAPDLPRNKADLDDGGEIEVYTNGRYFTTTGQQLTETYPRLSDMTESLCWLRSRYLSRSFDNTQITGDETPREVEATGVPPPNEVDAPADIVRRAEAYLRKCEPAVSGKGGHSKTWDAALAVVRGFRLSTAQAMDLLHREFNPRCEPPWSERDLRRKIREVRAKATVPWGYLADRAQDGTPNGQASPLVTEEEEGAAFTTARAILAARKPLGPAVSTGLPGLDVKLRGGLRRRKVYVLLGPAGGGKTTSGASYALEWMKAGGFVAVLPRDEGQDGIADRWAQAGGAPLDVLDAEDDDAVRECHAFAEKLSVLDGSHAILTPTQPRATVEALIRGAVKRAGERPLLLLIDSLQKVESERTRPDASPRERVNAVVDLARWAADEHSACVLVISQVNRSSWRDPKNATDKLAGGAESGQIEHGADFQLWYSRPPEGSTSQVRTVEVVKERKGRRGTVRYLIDPVTARIREMDESSLNDEETAKAEEVGRRKLNADADRVLGRLTKEPDGLSPTALRDMEGMSLPRIHAALKALEETGRAFPETRLGRGGGVRWKKATTPRERGE